MTNTKTARRTDLATARALAAAGCHSEAAALFAKHAISYVVVAALTN